MTTAWTNTIPLSSTPEMAGSYMAPRYSPILGPNTLANRSWLLEAIQEGNAFLRNNLAHGDIDRAVALICGAVEEKLPRKLSNISSNRIKRNVREMVAILSNLRPFWGYSSGDKRFDQQSEIYNKLMTGWFSDTFADLSIKEALQFAAVQGTGYLVVDWDPHYWPDGSGDISLRPKSARDILPVQLPDSKNLQHAYAVLIKEEMPITHAWARWPEYQHLIKPDRFDTTRGASKILYPFHALINGVRGRSQNTKPTPWPTVDVYYAYICDVSHNDSQSDMIVGGASRGPSYTVPSINSILPGGRGLASTQDALLFPDRRLMIGTSSCIMYDGPSFWIHGMAPVVKFSLDEWVWDYLGFSLIKDVASIQRSKNSLLRAIDDNANVRLRPPMIFDKSSVPKDQAERFDPRQPGQKMMVDMQLSADVIKFPIPPQYYDVPQWINEYIKYLDETTDHLMGQPGVKELSKASQIPSSDSIEKFLEMSGSIAQDMARSMERSLRGLGQMVLGNFIQYYSLPRRLKVLGKDGITPEDLDFDPGNMIPGDDDLSFEQRRRNHYRRFTYRVTPNSMTQMHSMSTRLLYLQLQKTGFPIDWFSLAKLLDIPNFAPEPEGTNNMLERWEWQQKFLLKLQMDAQAEMQAAQQPANPLEAIASILGGAGGGGENGGPGQGAGGGRPPSFNEAPQMETKSDGRTTITTS